MTTIYTPVKGYTGPGVGGLQFEDGRAETDDPRVVAYCRAAGYGIDGPPPEREEPEPADPREHGTEHLGTRLRDAAVDPEPGDFLPPTNAGESNPHGPAVVAPGIHAAPPSPIVPGPVTSEDPAAQEQRETSVAEKVLAMGQNVTEALADGINTDPQPERPTKSATKGEWVEYAVASGMDREEAEATTKDALIERYGG